MTFATRVVLEELTQRIERYQADTMDKVAREMKYLNDKVNNNASGYRVSTLEDRIGKMEREGISSAAFNAILRRLEKLEQPTKGLPKMMYKLKMMAPKHELAEPDVAYEAVPICPLCKKDA